MRPQEYLNYPVLDIIFEGRNKSYGAYALRNSYDQNMRKALIISFLLILSAFAAPVIFAKIVGAKPVEVETSIVVNLMDDVNLEEKVIAQPKQKVEAAKPAPPKATLSFTTPKVVPNDVIETGEIPPVDIKTEIGAKTVDGTNQVSLQTVEPPIVTTLSNPITEPTPTTGNDIPYSILEQQAEFQDGLQALYKWLGSNIKYPTICRENGIKGKVVVRFIVEKDGSINQPQVVRSAHPSLDEEALRVVKMMPRWKPGKQQGRAVRSYFTLPIKFELQ
jgi:periplasmic protein TonB